MVKIPLYDQSGKKNGDLRLPESIFGVPFNRALVHQAVVAEEAGRRQGTHAVLGRSDVRGGGKKPYRQKGTGRARQGTTRAPQFRHGGVVGGPVVRDHRKAFPVKMHRQAMRCALSAKVVADAMIGLDALDLERTEARPGVSLIKTRTARAALAALGLADLRRILVVVPEYDADVLRAVRNLPGVELRFATNFTVRDVLTAERIVLMKKALGKIEGAWAPRKTTEKAATEAPE